jgi:hypothetical protein
LFLAQANWGNTIGRRAALAAQSGIRHRDKLICHAFTFAEKMHSDNFHKYRIEFWTALGAIAGLITAYVAYQNMNSADTQIKPISKTYLEEVKEEKRNLFYILVPHDGDEISPTADIQGMTPKPKMEYGIVVTVPKSGKILLQTEEVRVTENGFVYGKLLLANYPELSGMNVELRLVGLRDEPQRISYTVEDIGFKSASVTVRIK